MSTLDCWMQCCAIWYWSTTRFPLCFSRGQTMQLILLHAMFQNVFGLFTRKPLCLRAFELHWAFPLIILALIEPLYLRNSHCSALESFDRTSSTSPLPPNQLTSTRFFFYPPAPSHLSTSVPTNATFNPSQIQAHSSYKHSMVREDDLLYGLLQGVITYLKLQITEGFPLFIMVIQCHCFHPGVVCISQVIHVSPVNLETRSSLILNIYKAFSNRLFFHDHRSTISHRYKSIKYIPGVFHVWHRSLFWYAWLGEAKEVNAKNACCSRLLFIYWLTAVWRYVNPNWIQYK